MTHKRFVKVSCTGVPSLKYKYSKGNPYNNPYGSEYAMFTCEDGSAARMLVSWDVPSYGGEDGRIWGQKGCYVPEKGGYRGWFDAEVKKMAIAKPPARPQAVRGRQDCPRHDDCRRLRAPLGHEGRRDAVRPRGGVNHGTNCAIGCQI